MAKNPTMAVVLEDDRIDFMTVRVKGGWDREEGGKVARRRVSVYVR